MLMHDGTRETSMEFPHELCSCMMGLERQARAEFPHESCSCMMHQVSGCNKEGTRCLDNSAKRLHSVACVGNTVSRMADA